MDKEINNEVYGWDEASRGVEIDHERAAHQYATSADRDEIL